ncbi:MAG TPA: hypothetical protein VFN35_29055, partial [Ktedonobacteraceae bacterium]|nr:hypothetical protein [Ktedonobacteraceae bacterium]
LSFIGQSRTTMGRNTNGAQGLSPIVGLGWGSRKTPSKPKGNQIGTLGERVRASVSPKEAHR